MIFITTAFVTDIVSTGLNLAMQVIEKVKLI